MCIRDRSHSAHEFWIEIPAHCCSVFLPAAAKLAVQISETANSELQQFLDFLFLVDLFLASS
eukprot:2756950-Rhodomonas_salina.1